MRQVDESPRFECLSDDAGRMIDCGIVWTKEVT